MPLSVTNRNHLSQSEITAITSYNTHSEVLALDLAAEGGPKITTLARSEVTWWQLFLRNFGYGTLVGKRVYLTQIADHLNQYDWTEASRLSEHSDLYQAYLKVCTLANKAVHRKSHLSLYHNVGIDSIEKRIEFAQYRGQELQHRHNVVYTFKWNPCLQAKHLHTLLRRQYSSASIRLEDSSHQRMTLETNLSKEALKAAHIYVEHRITPEVQVVHVPVPVPTPEKNNPKGKKDCKIS